MSTNRAVVTIPFAEHNLQSPDSYLLRRESMREALNHMRGGCGVLNEIHGSDIAYLGAQASLRGLAVYRYGSNAVLYTPRLIKLDFKRAKLLMRGGYVGADGVATPRKGDDDRRVGPNRYMLQAGLTIKSINFRFQLNGTHKMAKKDTTHKWRRPLWERAFAVGGDLIADALDTHPTAITSGDLNSRDYRDWPGVPDVVIRTPATYGKGAHYDQVSATGRVRVTDVTTFVTRSDHKGVKCLLHFSHAYAPLKAALEPKRVKKAVAVKAKKVKVNWLRRGAPVKHPWAGKSPEWKRRNPRLWRRIVAWRKAYRKGKR